MPPPDFVHLTPDCGSGDVKSAGMEATHRTAESHRTRCSLGPPDILVLLSDGHHLLAGWSAECRRGGVQRAIKESSMILVMSPIDSGTHGFPTFLRGDLLCINLFGGLYIIVG